ncbi:MAG: ABC transporter permease [Chloroflexota bacterium]
MAEVAGTVAPVADRRRQILSTVLRFQAYFGLLTVFLLGVIFSPTRRGINLFIDPVNQANIVRDIAENGIIAIGMTLVILIGGIDLSVGAVVALVATTGAAMLMRVGLGTELTILTMLALGALIGFTNGLVSTRFRIQSFIVTLAMMSVARGLARIISTGLAIPIAYGVGAAPESFSWLGIRIGPGIPVPALIMLVLALLTGLMLNYTSFGRHIYAIGGNDVAARLSGVRVDRIKIAVFVLGSMFAALAGLIHAAQLNQGSPNEAVGYELNAIAAVVIGGTSLMGGVGTITGTVIGALMLGMLDNILGLNNVNSDIQLLIKGALIVGAVILQQLRPRD